VIITDGMSQDDVSQPAQDLRGLGKILSIMHLVTCFKLGLREEQNSFRV